MAKSRKQSISAANKTTGKALLNRSFDNDPKKAATSRAIANAINVEAMDRLRRKFKMTSGVNKGHVVTPLEFLVTVYGDNDVDIKTRVDAAGLCMKYIHVMVPTPLPDPVQPLDSAGTEVNASAAGAMVRDFLRKNGTDDSTTIN